MTFYLNSIQSVSMVGLISNAEYLIAFEDAHYDLGQVVHRVRETGERGEDGLVAENLSAAAGRDHRQVPLGRQAS